MKLKPHQDIMRGAVESLREAGIPDPGGDARRLWAFTMPHRYADHDALPEGVVTDGFLDAITRRATHEPVTHIIGMRAFWKHDFIVTPDVLDPRPDTETLVEAALDAPFDSVLDLGTGSGCILLSLLAERQIAGTGADISPAALDVAARNAEQLGLSPLVTFIQSDWFAKIGGRFDLIVSNPPYITAPAYETLDRTVRDFEPKIALTPGGDGLDAYRLIASQAPGYLTPGGRVLVEIGYDQGPAVIELFNTAGFNQTRCLEDLNGRNRVICAKLRRKSGQ